MIVIICGYSLPSNFDIVYFIESIKLIIFIYLAALGSSHTYHYHIHELHNPSLLAKWRSVFLQKEGQAVGGGGWDGARMGCRGLQEWGRGAGVEGYRSGEGRMKSLAETREGLDQYHFFFLLPHSGRFPPTILALCKPYHYQTLGYLLKQPKRNTKYWSIALPTSGNLYNGHMVC